MRRLAILAAALVALPLSAQAADYAWPVVRVIDGDTIVFDASADFPPELAEMRVRLRGIDAPEMGHRAECEAERAAAARATAFVARELGAAGTIAVRDLAWGKWGGRVIADVVLDGGPSLANLVAYFGHARRDSDAGAARGWCGEAAAPAGDRVVDFVDSLLAEQDARQADEAGAADYRTEFARHVLDPCLAAALRSGHIDPALVSGLGERAALARLKSLATAPIAATAPGFERLVAGRPDAVRQKLYDALHAVCLDDFAAGRQ